MTDHLLIDAWNVCWKIPEIAALIPARLAEARRIFNALVKNSLQDRKITYRIIYDGQPDIPPDRDTNDDRNVRFARDPQNADMLIISFLQKQKNPRLWTVITSDRELSRRVKALDAEIISSENFITRLHKKGRPAEAREAKGDGFLSRQELDYWLEKFNKK
jgi:predicted RNA-binding protein with PIN domain